MKANLNELYDLVLFSEDKNTNFREAMIALMFKEIVEPIQQGIYEHDEFDSSYFQTNKDILKGIDWMEEAGFDMNEEFEVKWN